MRHRFGLFLVIGLSHGKISECVLIQAGSACTIDQVEKQMQHAGWMPTIHRVTHTRAPTFREKGKLHV